MIVDERLRQPRRVAVLTDEKKERASRSRQKAAAREQQVKPFLKKLRRPEEQVEQQAVQAEQTGAREQPRGSADESAPAPQPTSAPAEL